PAPNAAFFVCDQEGRIIGCGRGSRELTGLSCKKVIGRQGRGVLGLALEGGDDAVGTVLEWGVRQLGKGVTVNAEGDLPAKAVADLFPAYDDDGGVLLSLSPSRESDLGADPLPSRRMSDRRRSLLILLLVFGLIAASAVV